MPSKATELREYNDAELVQRLAEAKEEHFNLRFQNATGELDNSARLGDVRRDIARLHTLLREREIAVELLGLEAEEIDRLIATAREISRTGRSGIYDARVTVDHVAIAELRGHSRTVGGAWVPATEADAKLK